MYWGAYLVNKNQQGALLSHKKTFRAVKINKWPDSDHEFMYLLDGIIYTLYQVTYNKLNNTFQNVSIFLKSFKSLRSKDIVTYLIWKWWKVKLWKTRIMRKKCSNCVRILEKCSLFVYFCSSYTNSINNCDYLLFRVCWSNRLEWAISKILAVVWIHTSVNPFPLPSHINDNMKVYCDYEVIFHRRRRFRKNLFLRQYVATAPLVCQGAH